VLPEAVRLCEPALNSPSSERLGEFRTPGGSAPPTTLRDTAPATPFVVAGCSLYPV
jgi:hypothetical protein